MNLKDITYLIAFLLVYAAAETIRCVRCKAKETCSIYDLERF